LQAVWLDSRRFAQALAAFYPRGNKTVVLSAEYTNHAAYRFVIEQMQARFTANSQRVPIDTTMVAACTTLWKSARCAHKFSARRPVL
jgi:hypothetical protein